MPIAVSTTGLPRTAMQDAAGPKLLDLARGGGGGTAAGPADVVALSKDALLLLKQAAPAPATQPLGRLLGQLDGLLSPATGAAPLVLPELGEKAGTAAKRAITVPDGAHPPELPKPAVAAADPASAMPLAPTLLRTAGKVLALLQRQPRDVPVQDGAGADGPIAANPVGLAAVARPEVQIALALSQVARHAPGIAGAGRARCRWPSTAALEQHGPGGHGKQLQSIRRGLMATLLALAVAALWVATTLDLTQARTACAVLLGAVCVVGVWRRFGARPRPLGRLPRAR